MEDQEIIFEQTYTIKWELIPRQFNWVAVDADGKANAYDKFAKPWVLRHFWINGCARMYLGSITAPPDDHFKTMIYERPNNNAT